MPDRRTCIYCDTSGFVRVEKVVKGGQSFRDFFCGKCSRSWRVADDGEREPTKRGETPRRRGDRR